ncbi:MAG TPA: helix-turn-helix domain-containing protein [Mycobacterium sp.]
MAEGLRERSRARRRSEIESAALRLFAARGYDGTTVAQVAEAAEVSPRTVSLYFPSKLDLALSYIADSARRLSAACATRGPGRSTLDVLTQWLRDENTDYADTVALLRSMLEANPALRGAETPEIADSRRQVALELAADLGRSPDDPVVLLINGALAGIIAALIQVDPQNSGGTVLLDTTLLDTAGRMMDAVIATGRG